MMVLSPVTRHNKEIAALQKQVWMLWSVVAVLLISVVLLGASTITQDRTDQHQNDSIRGLIELYERGR